VNLFTIPLFDVVNMKAKRQEENNPLAKMFNNRVGLDFSLFVELEWQIFSFGVFV